MQYRDGKIAALGDIVSVPVPGGTADARIVMLGETYDHLDIDPQFLSWVVRERKLENDSVVVEWLGSNPLSHQDPAYAAVGNYMFTPLDEWVARVT